MKPFVSVIFVFCTLIIASCVAPLKDRYVAMPTMQELMTVKKGMVPRQVKEILGYPSWQGNDKLGTYYWAYMASQDGILVNRLDSFLIIYDEQMRVKEIKVQKSRNSGELIPLPFIKTDTKQIK